MQPFRLWLAEARRAWGGFFGILDLVLPSRPIITILALIVEGRCAGVGANVEGAQVLQAFDMPWRTMLWLKVLANQVCSGHKCLLAKEFLAWALLARVLSIKADGQDLLPSHCLVAVQASSMHAYMWLHFSDDAN